MLHAILINFMSNTDSSAERKQYRHRSDGFWRISHIRVITICKIYHFIYLKHYFQSLVWTCKWGNRIFTQ